MPRSNIECTQPMICPIAPRWRTDELSNCYQLRGMWGSRDLECRNNPLGKSYAGCVARAFSWNSLPCPPRNKQTNGRVAPSVATPGRTPTEPCGTATKEPKALGQRRRLTTTRLQIVCTIPAYLRRNTRFAVIFDNNARSSHTEHQPYRDTRQL